LYEFDAGIAMLVTKHGSTAKSNEDGEESAGRVPP
jgi:hypothetical protein